MARKFSPWPTRKVKKPKQGTHACREFFLSWDQINQLLLFVMNSLGRMDEIGKTAHETLVQFAEGEELARLNEEWKGRRSALQGLADQKQIFCEIFFVRHVENYLNYLSSLLFEIFTQKPETLKSSDSITIEKALSHDSMSELAAEIAEDRVASLSYKSFQELNLFFEKRFKVGLIQKHEMSKMVEFVETRNISVHNRCKVNKRYASKSGNSSIKMGQLRTMTLTDVDDLASIVATSVRSVDTEIRKLLRLRGARFKKSTEKKTDARLLK